MPVGSRRWHVIGQTRGRFLVGKRGALAGKYSVLAARDAMPVPGRRGGGRPLGPGRVGWDGGVAGRTVLLVQVFRPFGSGGMLVVAEQPGLGFGGVLRELPGWSA